MKALTCDMEYAIDAPKKESIVSDQDTRLLSQLGQATLPRTPVLPKGEFKQNARGFYLFYPAHGQALSAHDCRRVAAWLKEHNAVPQKGPKCEALDHT